MKEPIRFIRQKIFTLLNGNVSYGGSNVPVFNRVPSTQSEPYIIIYSADTSQTNQNQTDFIVECITRIEVVTAFLSDDGGELQVNDIVESILELIKTSTTDFFDLTSNNFNVFTSNINGIAYSEENDDEKTYYRAIIDIANRVQQN
mgnify:FL=1|jgi:hypothetical protein|tara:strand:- start:137 stop:574 length:438 start_codon:yes stop_codon:yes gene_type:complete